MNFGARTYCSHGASVEDLGFSLKTFGAIWDEKRKPQMSLSCRNVFVKSTVAGGISTYCNMAYLNCVFSSDHPDGLMIL